MLKQLFAAGCIAALAGGMSTNAFAADHQVKMLNKDAEGRIMQFEPAFLKIAPGDTVTFVPVDKGHSSDSIDGMIPDGAASWTGKINQGITVTLTKEGVYGYKCLPHFGLGMIGLIEVGDNPSNLDVAKKAKLPPKAQKRMQELFDQVE